MEIMKQSEALDFLINRYNADPLNDNKFHFVYEEGNAEIPTQNSTTFTIEFGTTKENASIFKEYVRIGEDLEKAKERIYSHVIDYFLTSVFNRMHSGTFADYGNLEIVRIDQNEQIIRVKN